MNDNLWAKISVFCLWVCLLISCVVNIRQDIKIHAIKQSINRIENSLNMEEADD